MQSNMMVVRDNKERGANLPCLFVVILARYLHIAIYLNATEPLLKALTP